MNVMNFVLVIHFIVKLRMKCINFCVNFFEEAKEILGNNKN